MKRRRNVPHEITLFAFTDDESEGRRIFDIIETSRRRASHWARRWIRDVNVDAILAVAPGTPITSIRSADARAICRYQIVPT